VCLFKNVCSSVLELFLSNDVLYYVILYYVSYFVLTPGRVVADFATANGDPNKIPNTKFVQWDNQRRGGRGSKERGAGVFTPQAIGGPLVAGGQ
jgi:hypothetical protein